MLSCVQILPSPQKQYLQVRALNSDTQLRGTLDWKSQNSQPKASLLIWWH